MRNFISILFLFLSLSLFAQPSNDEACSPTIISNCSLTFGTTVNATPDDMSSPGNCNNSSYTGVFFNYNSVGNNYLQIKVTDMESSTPVEILFGKWADECNSIFQVLGEYCGIAEDAEINVFGIEDTEYVVYVSTPSNNQSDFNVHVCSDPFINCDSPSDCSNAFDIGQIGSTINCNTIGCNLGVSDNGSLGDCEHEGIIWCKFSMGAEDFQVNINVSASDNGIPVFNIYSGSCGNLVPLGNCQEGDAIYGNIYDLSSNTTYFIGISTENYPVNELTVCIDQYGFPGGPGSVCTVDHELNAVSTSLGSPLDGPYQPCETVQFCYTLNSYTAVDNNCQWLQGIIPVFGNGWDPSSFDSEGMPEVTTEITPYNSDAVWDWYTDVTYNTTLSGVSAKKSVDDFDMDGEIEMCSYLEDDCPNTGITAGDLVPPGWFAWSTDGVGQSGHPNVDYGDGIGCAPNQGPWQVCFDLIANCNPDCNSTDCNQTDLKIYTTSDGETGAWSGGTSTCINDEPAIFLSTVEGSEPLVSGLNVEEVGSFFMVSTNSNDVQFIDWNISSSNTVSLTAQSIFLASSENTVIDVNYNLYSGIQELSGTSNIIFDLNTEVSIQPYESCENTSFVIEDNLPNDILSKTWEIEGGQIINEFPNGVEVIFDQSGSYDVELSYIDQYGNGSSSIFEDIVTILPAPLIENITYNYNDLVTEFSFEGDYVSTVLWNFGDGLSSEELAPIHQYANPGIYEVEITIENDCGSHSYSEIIQIHKAKISFDNSEYCTDDILIFINDTEEFIDYEWEFPNGDIIDIDGNNIYVSYTEPGDYIGYLYTIHDFGSSSDEIIFSINNSPNAAFSYQINGNQLLLENSSSYAFNYNWNISSIANTINEENPSITIFENGTYFVELVAESNCGNDTSYQEVIFNSFPESTINYDTDEFCANGMVQFSDTFYNDTEIERLWYFEGGNPETSTDSSVSVIYDSPGQYDVSLISSNEIGADTLTLLDVITVSQVAEANFNYEVDSFINNSTGGTEFFWDFGDGTTSNQEIPDHKYSKNGTFLAVLIAENSCNADTFSQEINIDVFPEIELFYNQDEFCNPASIVFNDTFNNGTLIERTWYFEGGEPEVSSENPVEVNYPEGGQFDVSLISKNQYGEDTLLLSDVININQSAESNFIYNNEVDSFINNSNGGTEFFWDFGDGFTSIQEVPDHKYSTNGTFLAQLIVENACNADTFSQEINIDIFPEIELVINQDEFCNPTSVVFSDTFNNGTIIERTWYFEGGEPEVSSENPIEVIYPEAGQFDVSLISKNQYGEYTLSVNDLIEVYETPTADFDYNQNEDFFVNNSTDNANYFWDFGDGNTSTEKEPDHQYNQNGDYEVVLKVTKNGCENEIAKTITVLIVNTINYKEGTINIFPNPITDNSDIYIEGVEYGFYDLIILDLSGNITQVEQIEINSNLISINIKEDLPTGIYNLVLLGKKRNLRGRFIKI